jgi:hypothetical protein
VGAFYLLRHGAVGSEWVGNQMVIKTQPEMTKYNRHPLPIGTGNITLRICKQKGILEGIHEEKCRNLWISSIKANISSYRIMYQISLLSFLIFEENFPKFFLV